MTYEDRRLELLIAAIIGAVLGGVTAIVLGYGPAYTVIWALIGAVVVGELVYWLRGFRLL
jgi:uncharacterized membrane protein YeaQ/YmgE (transglycosylase-associated protein family)